MFVRVIEHHSIKSKFYMKIVFCEELEVITFIYLFVSLFII